MYCQQLRYSLDLDNLHSKKTLSFNDKQSETDVFPLHFQHNRPSSDKFRTACARIFDAPGLMDDYYLNLLDCSVHDTIFVGLGNKIFGKKDGIGHDAFCVGGIATIEYIASVMCEPVDGVYVAAGTSNNKVLIWNVDRGSSFIRSMSCHSERVASLAWKGPNLFAGDRTGAIVCYDVRCCDPKVQMFRGHSKEVCGLKTAPNPCSYQLASGGNDDIINVWDLRRVTGCYAKAHAAAPLFRFTEHKAAVKALAWNPRKRNLLASGGGTADKTMRFWQTNTGACCGSVYTDSQVCTLQWSPKGDQIVSGQGYSHYQLTIWTDTMSRQADLFGHTSRVLHMTTSSDGTTIITAGPDETVRYWDIFDLPKKRDDTYSMMDSLPIIR